MTIGIAVRGPGAGAAILTALARLEAVADGAIGGFVSLAAMADDGAVHRAAIQHGGAGALMGRCGSGPLRDASLAVLMSSGPDRPEPLAQFTPARAGVGLVTGHRFPNANGPAGKPLAEEALDLMGAGMSPHDAARRIAARNPQADAGLILLGADGRIGLANTALVTRHGDLGAALSQTETHAIGVLHNSIAPHALLAQLAVHLVERALVRTEAAPAFVRMVSGAPVRTAAPSSRMCVGADGAVTALDIATVHHGDVPWSAGLGPGAEIVAADGVVGHALADPFLVIRDGRLLTADGLTTLSVPYRMA